MWDSGTQGCPKDGTRMKESGGWRWESQGILQDGGILLEDDVDSLVSPELFVED